MAEGAIPPGILRSVRVYAVPVEEACAANCVAVNRTLLAPAGFPATRRAIGAIGMRVRELETSEIGKADGSLTRLSLLL